MELVWLCVCNTINTLLSVGGLIGNLFILVFVDIIYVGVILGLTFVNPIPIFFTNGSSEIKEQ